MKNKKTILLQLLILTAVFSGCNFPLFKGAASTEETGDPIATQVAQTMEVYQSQLQQTQAYLDANPTATVMPTPALPAPNQPTLPAASSNSQKGCLIAGTVSETVPDGTAFPPGDPFTKKWTVINSGSCPWTSNYQLVFLSGEQMGGISPMNLGTNVPAGNITDISLALTAPKTPGTYRGDWALKAEDGSLVAVFWVQIVASDVGPFAITSATVSSNQNYTGSCPYDYTFSADITPNMFGSATYYFIIEHNGVKTTTATATVDFPNSKTKTVTATYQLSDGGDYTVQLYIDSPNHQAFGSADFDLTCN